MTIRADAHRDRVFELLILNNLYRLMYGTHLRLIGYLFGINGLHLAQATTGRAGAMWAIKAKGLWCNLRQVDPTGNAGRMFREQELIAPNDRHPHEAAERERRFH
jgi:hypothetical protein